MLPKCECGRDRVPGRTITAVEVGRHAHLIRSIPIAGQVEAPSIIDFLEAIGITVVPDPEPTNEERLRGLLKQSPVQSIDAWAAYLNDNGVRAPGGDDEH